MATRELLNWLFAGSERGGRTAALYLGLIQSCKACWEESYDRPGTSSHEMAGKHSFRR